MADTSAHESLVLELPSDGDWNCGSKVLGLISFSVSVSTHLLGFQSSQYLSPDNSVYNEYKLQVQVKAKATTTYATLRT